MAPWMFGPRRQPPIHPDSNRRAEPQGRDQRLRQRARRQALLAGDNQPAKHLEPKGLSECVEGANSLLFLHRPKIP